MNLLIRSRKPYLTMLRLILAASLCLLGLVSTSSSQNVEVLCKQLYTDCQACRVWDNECRGRPNRPPSNKPIQQQPPRPEHPHPAPAPARPTESPAWPPPQNTQPAPVWPPPQNSPAPSRPPQHPHPQPQPSYPESPEASPAVVPTQPPHNCVKYGHWCKSDAECCTKNCQLELVSMGPDHPDQHFTQSVCRD